MTQLKALLFSLFLSCVHTTIFAQIQKGNYNFGGDVALYTSSTSSPSFDNKESKLSLSPSVGKFLTNQWFVGLQPIFSTQTQNAKLSDSGSNVIYDSDFSQTSFGLGISNRYYFNVSDKTSLFGLVSGRYAHLLDKTLVKSAFLGNSQKKENYSLLTYSVGFGVDVVIKKDVFFETTLSYNASEYRGNGLNYGPDKYKDFSLNCGINHFILSPKKANFDDVTFIKKGRQMFGGGLSMSKTSSYLSIVANPKFSQFLTNNLLLSGEASFQSVKGDGASYQTITATVAARYYFPIQKRFFVYPELAYTRRQDIILLYDYNKNEMSVGLGGNYFLSENVALEATFLQARFNIFAEKNAQQRTLTGLVGLGNVGLVYFIR